MSDAAIYSRISKLLALASNTAATEAEAALAAEHVQRLLQEHNLTLSQVAATETADHREKVTVPPRALYAWQRDLMAALAENNFCLHRITKVFEPVSDGPRTQRVDGVPTRGRLRNRHLLVGRALNVQVTAQTYDYLAEAIARASPHPMTTREGNLFFSGAASRLTERLAERRREAEAAPPTTTGNGTHRELALSDVYGTEADLNNDHLCGFPAGTTAGQRREAEDRSARMAAEQRRLQEEDGLDWAEAWYRAHGYGDKSVDLAKNYNKRSRRRGGRGRSTNWTQSNEREHRKTNSPSYQAGRAAGSSIGLDTQVGGTAGRRAIGGK